MRSELGTDTNYHRRRRDLSVRVFNTALYRVLLASEESKE